MMKIKIFSYNVTAHIEPDEAAAGMWKVVFRDSRKDLIGTPLRNVTKEVATRSIRPLIFAFDYGVRAAQCASANVRVHVQEA